MLILRRNILKVCSNSTKNGSSGMIVEFSNKINPGSRRRIKLLNEDKSPDTDMEDLDYESDFTNVHRSHKEYVREMEILREKHQYDIVKQKYFKVKYPNFLTWHDKEQIRLLHYRDPEEWTISKLSEGFPALPEIINKILKANWKPKNIEKIKKHDMNVRENWTKFRNNEMNDLPKPLIEHLKKFTERDVNFYNYENVQTTEKITFNLKPSCTEFSEIITSYEKLKNKNEESKKEFTVKLKDKKVHKQRPPENEDTYIQGEIKNKHPMTLDTLKKTLQNKLDNDRNISHTEISIVEGTKNEIKTQEKNDQVISAKYNTGKLMVVDDKKPKDYNHLMYPEKIIIPEKIYKKGFTYKLNDCYYDSDGTFLYRVPGMY